MKNETKKHEQKIQPEELPARDTSQQKKPANNPYAWGRPTVAPWADNHYALPVLSRKFKRLRAMARGDRYWTPGCGLILSIDEK
nr:MAG: hypothetical protein [Microvirus sp.]